MAMVLALLNRFDEAAQAVLNVLWLNPMDHQAPISY